VRVSVWPLLVALAASPVASAPPKILVLGIGTDPQLAADLEHVRAAHGVPGMGVALVRDRQVRIGVAGKRRVDRDVPLADDDAFDLDAQTGVVVASVLARFVDRGVLRWDETLGEMLPDAKDRAATTLEQLLIDANDPALIRVVERAAGTPWAQVVQDEVFAPLRITGCGFGPTTGHDVKAGAYVPIDDNALHCSLADWSRFAAAQAGGYTGAWLSAASRAHVVAADGTTALTRNSHADAELVVIPARHAAVLVTVNAGDDRAHAAADDMIKVLLARLH
jgi:CubicO group peptidase (beta-lactamase class C family)